jgi:hypothetical protein
MRLHSSDYTGWKKRVYKREKEQTRLRIDLRALIFEAKKAACSTETTEQELQEISEALGHELEVGESYRASSKAEVDKTQNLIAKCTKLMEKSRKLNKKLRQRWLELHTLGLTQTRRAKVETIGEEDDYDVTLRCLEREVARAGDDVEFLRAFYGRADGEEEEEDQPGGLATEVFTADLDDDADLDPAADGEVVDAPESDLDEDLNNSRLLFQQAAAGGAGGSDGELTD